MNIRGKTFLYPLIPQARIKNPSPSKTKPAPQFSGAPSYPGFPSKVVAFIQEVLRHCKYEKDIERLLTPRYPLKAVFDQGGITTLYNYNVYSQSAHEIKGVCHELSKTVGHILQKKLNHT